MEQVTDFISTLTATQWLIAVALIIMLAKKLIKWAIIIGLIVFVAFPYIKSSGMLDLDLSKDGILSMILRQLGL